MKILKWLFGSDESLETYFQEARQRYNLKDYPLLASNRKANPEQVYTPPKD